MASKHKFLYAREQRVSSSETGSYQQKILSENKNVVSILQWVTGLPILFFWFAILGKIHTCLFWFKLLLDSTFVTLKASLPEILKN